MRGKTAKSETVNRLPVTATVSLQNLADMVPGMIVVYNINTGRYVYVNQSVKKILGYTPEDFLNKGLEFVTSLVHPDDFPMIISRNQAALKAANRAGPSTNDKEPILNFEYRMRHKDGTWIWLHTDGSIYDRSPDGRVNHVINISIDITERKEQEEQLRRLSRQLEEQVETASAQAIAERNSKDEELRVKTALLENMVEGVSLSDESGTIVYTNPAEDKMFGYKRGELIGKHVTVQNTYPPEENRRIVSQVIKQLKSNGVWEGEFSNIKKDGTHFTTFARITTLELHGKTHRMCVQEDVTERKEAEERLALALKAAQMGTWEWNISTGELTWSDQLKVLFGLKPSETVTYEKYLQLIHPEDRLKMQATIKQAIKTGEGYKAEHRIIWPNGSVHWLLGQGQAFLENGKPVRMLGTSSNIDERKATEEALAASQIKYKTLFESNVIGVFIPDLEGRILEANDKFLAMIGYTKKDLEQGKVRWDAMTPPEYKDIDIEKVRELQTNGEATPWEKEYIRKDGTRVPVLLGIVMIPNTDNLCVTIVIDITERQELQALNTAKDEFISLASHQLRTPATAVKQYVGMLMGEFFGELNDKQQFMLQSAYESNERQLTIINDLLRVARLDANKVQLHKEKTDVIELLNGVMREQSIRFKARRQTVNKEYENQKLHAFLDKDRMHMVLGNLIDNAGKYTPQGKGITVRAKSDGQQVQIEVEDEGVGIDKKDFDKLFQKFSRVDNPLSTIVGGSGLGLYWSKRVIDLHGGTIKVRSKVDHGTKFTVTLPLK